MDFTFPRSTRLLNAKQFQYVFDGADHRISSSHILILARVQSTDIVLPSRLGTIVAKKKVRRAVDRNRFKRISRESFRKHRTELIQLDIIVMAKVGAGELDAQTLTNQFNQLWPKLIRRSSKSGKTERNDR